MMKKLLSILLSVCLMSTLAAPAFAAEPQGSIPPELVADATKTIGSSQDENFEYYSVIDNENKTAQAIWKDLSTGEYIYGPKVSFAQSTQDSPLRAPDHSITHQDTFLNYEYDIYPNKSPVEWSLQRPNIAIFSQYYFMVYENTSNRRYLEYYQDDVEALNDQEWTTIGYIGIGVFETVEALMTSQAAISTYGVLTGEAAVSIVDAISAIGDAADAVFTLIDYYNDCSESYRDVLNNTDNIHY